MTKVFLDPRPKPKQSILDIKAYVPGSHYLESFDAPIVLSANETPLGPSPKAKAAFVSSSENLGRYPDGSCQILKRAIADVHGLNPSRVVCGAGSDEILSLIAQSYLSENDEAIYTEHGFLLYKIVILAAGATPVAAKESYFTASIENILACVTNRTKVVFLANPNNPTGTFVSIEDVCKLRQSLPEDVLLVLDAAYAEYVHRNDYEAGIQLAATTSNTVMTRTFSKIYGLAALRLGWAYCSAEIADVLNRVRGPFNVSAPAIAAGSAAIADFEHLERARQHNDTWLVWLTNEISKLGIEVTNSVGNFVLIHFSESSNSAVKVDAFLKANGIICRRAEGYGLAGSLRITIGTEKENRLLIETLSRFTSSNGK